MSFELPEGPVTIMFTDIEGSTALRTSLGDSATDALFRQHDQLVREQIEAHRGHDQKAALGDGFLAVFTSTRRAVACAGEIQRALDAFNRSRSGVPLRVRIGLNTGEIAQHDEQLTGEAVHAASRVCAAASGGQILVSDVTRQLAGTVPDVTFADAGEHDLRGFPQRCRLWEVAWVRESAQLPEQVFVGRETELARLRSKLASALEGEGGLVLVGGEPGVGKTTLVKQLIREAEQKGAFAAFGRCYESEGAVPYSPFVEMVEQALAVMPPEIVREDMGEDAGEVARMVPELRRRFPDIPDPLDLPPEQQRRYFFNAIGAFITRAQNRSPLVLVMDDVHWADEPTLLLIEHMAELMPELRVLAIATYRDVELDVSRPLAATMERFFRSHLAERLPVHRFERDLVAQMLEALGGKAVPDVLVNVIFDETEGNPFFVEEVFRHLVEEGKVFDENGEFRSSVRVGDLDVPESVRLVVGRRLERLGPQALKVLAAAAVVGRGFPFALLQEIGGAEPGELLDVVDEAEAAKVIVPEDRGGEAHYTFAHELIRQTLLGTVSLPRRQRLHLAVADAIERTDPGACDTKPSELAYHLLEAGAAADPERTIDLLERTADRAYEGAAFEEAARAVDDALHLLPEDDIDRRTLLQEKLGRAFRALGRFEESLDIWDRVVDTYAELGKAEAAADLCREMAYQYLWLGRFNDVFATNQRGIDILGDRTVASRAYLVSGMGALLGLGGYPEPAEERIAEAEEIARGLGDERALGWVNWTRCVARYSAADFPGAIDSGTMAIDQLQRTGDPWTLCDALSWTALGFAISGANERALSMGTEGLELSRRLGHVGGEILSHRAVLVTEGMRSADIERVESMVRYDLHLCQNIRSPWVSQSHVWLGVIAQLRGRVEEALGYIEQGIELEPVSTFGGFGEGYRLLNRAFANDRPGFLSLLESARPRLPGGANTTPWGTVIHVWTAAQGAVFFGLEDVAAELHPHLVETATQIPVEGFDFNISARVCGMSAALLGRWDEAEVHFEDARRLAAEIPNAFDAPGVEHWYGKMLLDRGLPQDRDRARAMIGSALTEYRRIGLPIYAAMAEQLLR